MYNRFENGIHPRESVKEIGGMLKDHVEVLRDHLNLLQKVTFIRVHLSSIQALRFSFPTRPARVSAWRGTVVFGGCPKNELKSDQKRQRLRHYSECRYNQHVPYSGS